MSYKEDCVFCNIAQKKIASHILYETDNVIIIQDIMPKAPIHVQVMPKQHLISVAQLTEEHAGLIAEVIFAARDYAVTAGIAERGYKLVMNTGKEGGQVIPHLHMHLLGGKQLEE